MGRIKSVESPIKSEKRKVPIESYVTVAAASSAPGRSQSRYIGLNDSAAASVQFPFSPNATLRAKVLWQFT